MNTLARLINRHPFTLIYIALGAAAFRLAVDYIANA